MRTLLADIVLVLHFAIAAFIVGGLVLTYLGAALHWQWIRNFRFRLAHLAGIVFVAAEAVLGIVCPLTMWEDALRYGSDDRSFVARWVSRLLYYDFPESVFTAAYAAAALATVVGWWLIPPRRQLRRRV
jgi:hypothetical protein